MSATRGVTWVAAALALVVWAEWSFWPEDDQTQSHAELLPEPAMPVLTEREFRLPAFSVYREIVERPLFSRSRRPRRAAALPAETEYERFPIGIRLQAVVTASGGRAVVVHDAKSKATRYVGVDAIVRGWRIVEIRSDGVVLERGGRRFFLPLSGATRHSLR